MFVYFEKKKAPYFKHNFCLHGFLGHLFRTTNNRNTRVLDCCQSHRCDLENAIKNNDRAFFWSAELLNNNSTSKI